MPEYSLNHSPYNNVSTCSETVITSCQPKPWNITRRLKASYQMFSISGITAKILCHMFSLHISSPKQNLRITKIMGLSIETAKKNLKCTEHSCCILNQDSSVFHTMWLMAITTSITLCGTGPFYFFTYDWAMQSSHCHKSLCDSDVTCSMVHSPVLQITALYKKPLGKETKSTCPAASSHPVSHSTGITQCMQLVLNNSSYAYIEKGIYANYR